MTSYLTSIDTFSISYRFWDIWLQSFQGLTLTFRGHLRSKIFSLFESPCMTSYLISVDTFSLSHTVFEIFDFKVFRVWLWPSEVSWGQNYFHHSKAHSRLPIKRLINDTFSLYRTVFEIFDSNVFRVCLTLTFRGHVRSKIFSPFESPYTTSYLTSIDTSSLSCCFPHSISLVF